MPRDSTGLYTLPTAPVVPFTTILAEDWAGRALSDGIKYPPSGGIGEALTDTLGRSTISGTDPQMLGPMRLYDGALTSPGIAFTAEPTLGFDREGTALAALVASGTRCATLTLNEIQFPFTATMLKDSVIKALGFKSFITYHDTTQLTIAPSTVVDGDTPDAAGELNLLADGTLEAVKVLIGGPGQGITFSNGSFQNTRQGLKSVQRGVITIAQNQDFALFQLPTPVNIAKAELRWLGSAAQQTSTVPFNIQSAPTFITIVTQGQYIQAQRYSRGTPSPAAFVSFEVSEYY